MAFEGQGFHWAAVAIKAMWPLDRKDTAGCVVVALPGAWSLQNCQASDGCLSLARAEHAFHVGTKGQEVACPILAPITPVIELHYSISMLGVVRVLFIWLLAAAVPLKAIAMGSAIGCGPAHHGALAMERADFAPRVGQHTHEDGGSREAHHHHALAGSGGADDHERAGSPSGQAKVKCGTCAPCCTAAAPAIEGLASMIAPLPADGIPFASRYYADVQADVPHRPPRA